MLLRFGIISLVEDIVDIAYAKGYCAAGFWPARKKNGGWSMPILAENKGYPGLMLVKPGENGQPGCLIFIEVKVGSDKLSPEQQVWKDFLENSGRCEYYLVTDLGLSDIQSLI